MHIIKDKRERAGMTQGELAERLGVDRTTVTKWESGDAMPRADKLPDIAKALGCTVDELYGNVGTREQEQGK